MLVALDFQNWLRPIFYTPPPPPHTHTHKKNKKIKKASSFRGGLEQFCPSLLLCKVKSYQKEGFMKSSRNHLAVTAANAPIILWLITPNSALLRKSIDGVTGAIFGAIGTRSNLIYAYVLCWQVRRRFRERKRQGVQEERQEKGFLLNGILTFRGNCFVIGY